MSLQALTALADNQFGYFSSQQAIAAGYQNYNHSYHVRQGNWIHVDRGVYRLPGYTDTDESDFIRWSLWAIGRSPNRQIVISHNSALFHYGLAAGKPDAVHLTVPVKLFLKKEKNLCVFHRQELEDNDVLSQTGYLITTPFRTLVDMKPDLMLDSTWLRTVKAASEKELITQQQERELLGEVMYQQSVSTPRLRMQGQWYSAEDNPFRSDRKGANTVENDRKAGLLSANRQKRVVLSNRGFTLVELLVVIAVIAILASLLAPAMRKGMLMAKTASCSSNLKQVAFTFQAYANENSNYFPAANSGKSAGMENGQYTIYDWTYSLWPYIVGDYSVSACSPYAETFKNTVFFCPADPETVTGSLSITGGIGKYYRYGMNWCALSYPIGATSGDYKPLKQSNPRAPSRNVLVGEMYKRNTCMPYTFFTCGAGAVSHANGTNFLYFDNHIKRLNLIDIPQTSKVFWNGCK